MRTPRLLLLAVLVGLSGPARAGTDTAPVVPDLPRVVSRPPGAVPLGADEELPPASPASVAALKKIGWKVLADGGLERIDGPDKGVIPLNYVGKGGFYWKNGALTYSSTPNVVPEEMYAPMLRGLWSFTTAARTDRAKAGSLLAAWGLPPSVDGRRLYNPGGDATYYGIMLHYLLASKPDQAAKLGMERTSQALDSLGEAYSQAFLNQAADVAQVHIDRARLMLFAAPRGGETPLGSPAMKARPDPAAMLKGYKDQLQAENDAAVKAGDPARRKDSAEALAVLNTLERQRSHSYMDLDVPSPETPRDPERAKGGDYAPLASGLPGLLRVLDRVNGTPLTADQQESLIKSFPMGDLVWRMGAQDLWKQGLTGKGVKVAVIDEGVAENPEIDAVVKDRQNFTSQRGAGTVGSHGTHVAGIIHALAPEAELRSYAALASEGGNRALSENSDPGIIAAVRRAVQDGNQIINMSLGSGAGPSSALARVVEEYASKGVIFVIAAGNERDRTGGVSAPASAPSAITVGSLNSAGRMADSSSFGERLDARRITNVVKDIFMAPGVNITSTLPSSPGPFGKAPPRYGEMSGTSMATPAMSGISALLVQDMGAMTLVPNPVEAAQRLKSALVASSTPMELTKLPPTVPFDQSFFVVQPLKALEALRTAAVPVAGK